MRISDWSSDVCSSDLHLAGELAGAVGNELDVVQALLLAPGIHHEGVVHRETVDLVDAFGLELRIELVEIRELVGRAGRREGAGQIGRASCRERVCQYV